MNFVNFVVKTVDSIKKKLRPFPGEAQSTDISIYEAMVKLVNKNKTGFSAVKIIPSFKIS